MSKDIAMVDILQANPFRMSVVTLDIESMVVLFFLKPNWMSDNKWFLSRNQCSLSFIILSKILQRQLVSDIG